MKFKGALLNELMKNANRIRIKQILPVTIATHQVFFIPFPKGLGYSIAKEVQIKAIISDNANKVYRSYKKPMFFFLSSGEIFPCEILDKFIKLYYYA